LRLYGAIAGEVARALSVLALVFLSFAHQPLAGVDRTGPSEAVGVAVYCGAGLAGDPFDPRSTPRRACEVCRVATAIDLPTLPLVVCPVLLPLGRNPVDFRVAGMSATPPGVGGDPRAPPVRAAV
jgi:hypothetical protein